MLMIIGARGWEHEQWQTSYYPPEIAKDWHLSFYAREFETALAPVSLWSQCSLEEIKEFCTDVDEKYPLIFEKNNNEVTAESNPEILNLQKEMDEFIPNWVCFDSDGWQKEDSTYHIHQATILHSSNLKPESAVFKVSSNIALKDIVIREIMQFLKKEFKQYEVIYCYFDDELTAIDIINTAQALRKMLSLNY